MIQNELSGLYPNLALCEQKFFHFRKGELQSRGGLFRLHNSPSLKRRISIPGVQGWDATPFFVTYFVYQYSMKATGG